MVREGRRLTNALTFLPRKSVRVCSGFCLGAYLRGGFVPPASAQRLQQRRGIRIARGIGFRARNARLQ
ncbi:hypothetical protein G6F50_018618 [Rhizopus delemar]|uniref:Uncharacterized protein n=1 Tax=Rhizopus delemar TaxID=936053 RepID=A0A9P6XML9_9FUNG|nr:hypothetical protein G6F50_018618 [Rhizopus delemar]